MTAAKHPTGFSSDAQKDPVRVVFVTKNTSAKVTGEVGPQRMAYPHLLLREAIVFQVLAIVLTALALVWDAPLEQLANPLLTPNPAKAPWYFLGLQELLHYFPPLVAGIVIPTLVVLALIVIPYFNVNIEGTPLCAGQRRPLFIAVVVIFASVSGLLATFKAWTVLLPTLLIGILIVASFLSNAKGRIGIYLSNRPLSWWVMTWFILVAVILTLIGTFFRGPGWSWVWPWGSYGA